VAESVEERLIRIETKLEQVLDRMRAIDNKDERFELRLMELERQNAMWRGVIAVFALIWPIVIKYVMNY
jgi:hypothetical protein